MLCYPSLQTVTQYIYRSLYTKKQTQMSPSFKAELLLVNSLLHVWNETKVNGPLGSVFSDCNSVLLTLNISDEKGKQKIPVSKVVKQALTHREIF